MLDFTDSAADPRKADIRDLVPKHQRGPGSLTPESPVLVLNRGWNTYTDKFDGIDYDLPAGEVLEMPYGAALHFRARAVVPGTRNPEVKKQESFLVVMHPLGPDKRSAWRMFTDEERAWIEGKHEAIAREELSLASDRDVKLVSTGRVAASMPGAGAGGGNLKPQLGGDPREGMPSLDETLSPPEQNAALEEMRAAEAERAAEKRAEAAKRGARKKGAAADADEE